MTKKISVNVKSAPRNAEEVMDIFISEINSFTVSKRKVETTEKSEPIFVVSSITGTCWLGINCIVIHVNAYYNWTRTHNHLVHNRTLDHLAKLAFWLNSWVFVYEPSGCGFEFSCRHVNFWFRACFEQRVLWHSGNYRVWIHSETRTWHDKNIQFNACSLTFL